MIRLFVLLTLFISTITSCSLSKQEFISESEDSYSSMSQLSVSDPSVWSSMISQRGFSFNSTTDNNSGSYRSVIQKSSSYPIWDDTSSPRNYIYTIFEDQFPSMGDYDFNDVIIKSIYTLNEFTRDDQSNIEGWSGAIDSYLVHDGASYDFELVLMFYTAEIKDEIEYFTRIPNDQVQIEIDGTSVDYSSSTDPFKIPFSEFYQELGDEMFNDYSELTNGGSKGKEISFSISGVDNISDDPESNPASTRLWISTAIRVINTSEYILPAGYPDYDFRDENNNEDYGEFEIGYKNYLLDVDGYTNIPFCIEFIASSFNTPSESQFVLGQNIDLFKNILTTGVEVDPDPIGLEGIFIDSRDEKEYTYAKIGTQIWMTENLDYAPKNGDDPYIPNIDSGWSSLSNTASAYCYYDGSTYGALYTWTAAMNGSSSSSASPSGVQGICPNGWHLPSVKEWEILETYLFLNGHGYGSDPEYMQVAKSMATKTGWSTKNAGTKDIGKYPELNNSSNFSGTPGGYIHEYSGPLCLGENGYWWTSDEIGNNAYYCALHCSSPSLTYGTNYKKRTGCSIRCVKD